MYLWPPDRFILSISTLDPQGWGPELSSRGQFISKMVHVVIYDMWVQMVGRLLGQSGTASSDAAVPSVSPGDIGIICFHRAQVGSSTEQQSLVMSEGAGIGCTCTAICVPAYKLPGLVSKACG